MNPRELLLVVYAGILGWYLHEWWERKADCLVWEVAERAAARVRASTCGPESDTNRSTPS